MSKFLLVFLISFIASSCIAPLVIFLIKKLKAGQNILEYVDAHKLKQGTPTMGGVIFLIGLLVSYLVCFEKNNRLATLLLISTLGYGLLGFLDDFLKIKFKHNEGLKAYQKFIGQFGIAVIMAIFIYSSGMIGTSIILPFSNTQIDLGWGIIPFVIFFYLAVTNSVNLTDGLDGLAGKVSFVYLVFFSLIVIIVNQIFNGTTSEVLLTETKNILCLAFGLMGGLVAFLLFNCHPAKIFMGDTGSLALGGFISTFACFTKLQLLMPIIGLVFVINTISVILQVGYYKLTKKRIFKMAPLHHHFEKRGIKETKIVSWYTIITLILGIFCLWLTIL